jgi:hypothetical protein
MKTAGVEVSEARTPTAKMPPTSTTAAAMTTAAERMRPIGIDLTM